MLSLRQPSESEVFDYLRRQQDRQFSYEALGATRGTPPERYEVDRHRVLLGEGPVLFDRARQAIREWKMFPRGMTRLYWPERQIQRGVVVAVQVRTGPLWWLNPCRIVYTSDELELPEHVRAFGFAYGTLPDHVEEGEERFLVEWNRQDNSVWYDLLAFSRPRHPLARLGYPYVRATQARFRRRSGESMREAVGGSGQ